MASHEKTINGKRLVRWLAIFFVALLLLYDQTKHKKVARLLTALGPSLSERLVDALVDTYITPIGLSDLIADPSAAKDVQTSAGKPAVWKNVHRSRAKNAFFTGPRDFAVNVNGARLRFRWEDLGWRLREIDLPLGGKKAKETERTPVAARQWSCVV